MQFTARLALSAFLLSLPVGAAAQDAPEAANDMQGACRVGVFRAGPDSFVTLTRRDDGFIYTFDTGETEAVSMPEARVTCDGDQVVIDGASVWSRIELRETDTVFRSGEIDLVGRLLEPRGAGPDTPLIIYAHGSEDTAWIEQVRDPYQMVGRGISVFVYDKRGTGASGGQYTQNFPRLADDLVAATAEARRLAEGRYGRITLIGLSQGGWILPLAADRTGADALATGYGLAIDIREEDAAEVELALRSAGYGQEVIDNARLITDATARLATEQSEEALAALSDLRARFAEADWIGEVQGSYTGLLFNASDAEIRETLMPYFAAFEIDWSIDPVEALRAVEQPQLWILAGEDRAAPIHLTLERLQMLRAEGRDLTLYLFPDTDHGMWEFEQAPDGTRAYTRITGGYFDMLADWAHGRLGPTYGRAEQQ